MHTLVSSFLRVVTILQKVKVKHSPSVCNLCFYRDNNLGSLSSRFVTKAGMLFYNGYLLKVTKALQETHWFVPALMD